MRRRLIGFIIYLFVTFILLVSVSYNLGSSLTQQVKEQISQAHLAKLPQRTQEIAAKHPDAYPWFSNPPGNFLPPVVSSLVKDLMDIPGVYRVKLWDYHGTVIWSDQAQLVGENFSQNHHFQVAAMGRTSFNHKGLQKIENQTEQGHSNIIEVYIPLKKDGKTIGVIELYQSNAKLDMQLAEAERSIWKKITVAGIIIYFLGLICYGVCQTLIRRTKSDAS